MSLVPVLARLTPPRKMLLRLFSPIEPAPASMVAAPVPVMMLVFAACVTAPLAFTVRLPAAFSMVTPDNASAPMSRMAMLFAPLLVRFTAPTKLLAALSSVIAPAPALMLTAPVPVTTVPPP